VQTLVQVYCSKGPSLRERIARDAKLEKHLLQITKEQQPGRKPGWLKLRSTESDRHGAINVEWDADTGILTCRVITRSGGKPNLIVGDFVEYLLARHRTRVRHLVVIPR
jgi:hypothetical protein